MKAAVKGNKELKKVANAAKQAKKLKKKGEKIEAAYEKGVEAAEAV